MAEETTRSLPELLDEVAGSVHGLPVRPMEAVLRAGDAALPPLVELLGEVLDEEESGEGATARSSFWLVVLLGESRSPEAVPPLVDVLGRVAPGDVHLASMAAEGLAKIGSPAVVPLRALLAGAESHRRLWAYAALGWIADEEAWDTLREALASDTELVDAVAVALAETRRKEALPLLVDALGPADPRLRPEIEEAIRALHRGETAPLLPDEDWRLRYRVNFGLRALDPGWAGLMSLFRARNLHGKRPGEPLRSLDQILAAGEEPGPPPTCTCCGVPTWRGTGVEVCPDTAARVALMQWQLLEDARQKGFTDLFAVLDVVEGELWDVLEEPDPVSPEELERRQGSLTGLKALRAACLWLVEEGIEEVGGGRARLRAEARRAKELYGDRDEGRRVRLAEAAPGTGIPPGDARGAGAGGSAGTARTAPASQAGPPPGRAATAEVGRNDPCPCGSGRKYKRCCGAPAPGAVGREAG